MPYVLDLEHKGAAMATKELIKAEIDSVGEEYLDELYDVIKSFTQSKRYGGKQSSMPTWNGIKVGASAEQPHLSPEDDPLLSFIGAVEHGSLAQTIDDAICGK